MRKVWLLLILTMPVCTSAGAQEPDALDEALALAGLQRADLGWEAKGWWPRYPDVPYKLRAFDALFAEPLDVVTFTRSLGRTAWEKLDPAVLDTAQVRGSGTLYQAVQQLGIDPRFGGFRGYSANLTAPLTPLDEAILELTRAADRPTRFTTFGDESPYPRLEETLARQVTVLPAGAGPILGQLVLNIVEARRWAELAFRSVNPAARFEVARRYNLGEELIDALDYCPAVDDMARTWDEASLWYAAQKCVDALDLARRTLQGLDLGRVPDFVFAHETPWGWIRIHGGGRDRVDGTDALLVIDFGGNDTYLGGVAAATAERPLGLLLDLAGNDEYRSEQPAQGAGMCGVGVLIDASGDDRYEARHYAQGAGQFGLGLCVDLGGDDEYFNRFSGQGCGYFGVGLLFDTAGNDEYTLHAEGQGFGGAGGVGILADRTGDDRYLAVREHSVTGRPSYHSPDLDVSVSNCQGSGMGRRGDGGDGHSWAGGLGALLDGAGNDHYTAGNWSMGTGYWFGIGILHDRDGDDEYHGVAWSQGTGAHFCIGACLDEAGDDKHLSEENSVLSLGMAHDFTIGMLIDLDGDDLYGVDGSGLGQSLNRSLAMLIDCAGNDRYRSREVSRPGYAQNSESFRARDGVGTYFADTTSLALFLDLGGRDVYEGGWEETVGDDRTWLDPPDSPNWADRNFSVGVDRSEGTVDFTPRPVRVPSGP